MDKIAHRAAAAFALAIACGTLGSMWVGLLLSFVMWTEPQLVFQQNSWWIVPMCAIGGAWVGWRTAAE